MFESTPPEAAAQEKSAKLGQEKCTTAELEKSTIKPQLNATPVVNFDLDLSEDMFAESMLLEEVSTTLKDLSHQFEFQTLLVKVF